MRHAVFAICLKMELIKGIAPVSKHASSFLSHVFDKKVHGEAFAEHPQKTLGKESMPRQSLSTSLRRL
jgi:hypothetical protein